MFAYIMGILTVKTNQYVVVETAGIGYKIFMPQKSIDKLGELETEVKIHTYYYVREDNISLYGFLSNDELRMFELLISVSGIGAKSAITMLSEISTSDFAMAVITNDVSKLVKIPGIGSKTAARIVLELKDKLKTEQAIIKNDEEILSNVQNENAISEAITALQILGYTKREIDKAFEQFDVKTLSKTEDIIRKALSILGK